MFDKLYNVENNLTFLLLGCKDDLVEKNQVDRAFGRLLAQARKKAGLSQKQLGAAVGLSRASVANIESGKHGVQLSFLFRAAEILGTTAAKLMPEFDEGLDPAALEQKKFFKAVEQIVSRS